MKNFLNENRKHLCDLQYMVKERERDLALREETLREMTKRNEASEQPVEQLRRLEGEMVEK